MITIRTISLLTAALALSGCAAQSSYSGLVARSHADYERAVLSGERTVVSDEDAVLSQEGEVRPKARAKPRRAYASQRPPPAAAASERASPGGPSTTGSPIAEIPGEDPGTQSRAAPISDSTASDSLQISHPIDSPAWQREDAEWKRMESDLKRRLRSICTGC
jgi:hypothetical protein